MRKEKLLKAFKVTLLADGARSSVRIEHRREDEEGLPDEAFNPRVGGSIPPGPAFSILVVYMAQMIFNRVVFQIN